MEKSGNSEIFFSPLQLSRTHPASLWLQADFMGMCWLLKQTNKHLTDKLIHVHILQVKNDVVGKARGTR